MSTLDPALDKSRQVFNIPELVSLIAGQLGGCLTIENPFRRFDLYAPLVRSLDIYGPAYDYVKLSGWWTLISRNRRQPLLPNLLTLGIRSLCHTHGPDQAMWIQALASPSLLNLMITPTTFAGPTVSYPMASFILKSAVDLCPNLRFLGLFPDANLGDIGQDAESHFLMLLSHEPFYNHLAGLGRLRGLAGTTAWFNKKPLGILSRVPHLEFLAIYEWNNKRLDIVENSLPRDAFPSLRQLTLQMLHPYDVSKLLMTKGLVHHLTRLKLNFDLSGLNKAINKEEWLCRKIIYPLQNMPSLVSLVIKANSLGETVEIGSEALAVFSQLPLQTVSFVGMRIRADCLNPQLGNAWPYVTLFDMPAQCASLATLDRFASLPRLKELVLSLDLRTETLSKSYLMTNGSLNVLRSSSVNNSICSGAMGLDFVAR
ncbi:hypothetical protein FRC10_008109 [Ceratobasidium sp. 414]|nr:hypothetical protein FRC10_008109 [Ceratobasidium sp. 414]